MTGAAHLASRAAQRAGAGYVEARSPGVADDPMKPTEAVGHPLPGERWAGDVVADLERFATLAVGPGLGTADATADAIRQVVGETKVSTVVDGDGLTAIGARAMEVLAHRHPSAGPAVLTPHDGEFAQLAGEPPGPTDWVRRATSRPTWARSCCSKDRRPSLPHLTAESL